MKRVQHFLGNYQDFHLAGGLGVGRDGNNVGEISRVQIMKGPEGCLGLYSADNVNSLKDLEQRDDVNRFTNCMRFQGSVSRLLQ